MIETLLIYVLLVIVAISGGISIVGILAWLDSKKPVSEPPKPREYKDWDFWEQNEYWGD